MELRKNVIGKRRNHNDDGNIIKQYDELYKIKTDTECILLKVNFHVLKNRQDYKQSFKRIEIRDKDLNTHTGAGAGAENGVERRERNKKRV